MGQVLRDRVAFVTGGGRGIGREIARGLAAAGAAVAVTGRSSCHLEETVSHIEKQGGRAMSVPCDVADRAAVDLAVARVEGHLGPIGILVCNAAIEGPFGPMWEVDPDEWRRSLEVNLLGPFNCARAVLPTMTKRRAGRIINVGSAGGLWAVPYDTAYSTSKAALIRLTEGIAIECEPFGVCAWVIHPGVVRTGMSDAVLQSAAGQKWLPTYGQVLDDMCAPIEWASELCTFLASGEADGLSGCYISVDDRYRDMAKWASEVRARDVHTLRLKLHPTSAAPRWFQAPGARS